MSSGNSFAEINSKKIDNFQSIKEYDYEIKPFVKGNQEYKTIKDMDFFFEDYALDFTGYPQGMCFTPEYLFVTSYLEGREQLGELWVYSRKTGEYLFTLGMDGKSHLGGIAFDGKNIWVCNSANMTIERISYEFLTFLMAKHEEGYVDITPLINEYEVDNIPSCITFYDGRLWVASHDIWDNSVMKTYCFDEKNNRLESLSVYEIPPKVQGVAFDEIGRLYLSTSYGRKNSSYIYQYESILSLIEGIQCYDQKIELPPCSEEIEIADGTLYVLFESANITFLYGLDGKGESISPINQILAFSIP